jgi:hypothetical protein
VADLLECLIQIKGVADTPRRLGLRLAAGGPGASQPGRGATVVRSMAEAEACFRQCLALMLERERPPLPALPRVAFGEEGAGDAGEPSSAVWHAQFSARRGATVAVLEQCSAEQLGRIGLEPFRGPMTVADLVALMLAHDTDCLGAI